MPASIEEYDNSDAQAFWSAFVLPRVVHIEGTASHNEAGSKARAQQMLDNELAAVHLAMCTIRTRRNALSPISALPAELLVRIFEFYAAIYPPRSQRTQYHLGWIDVTHVCRLWRNTALRCSSLWSDVCFMLGPQWVETMIDRAKPAPLIIRQNVSALSWRSLVLISEYIPRALELSLIGPIHVIRSIIRTSRPPYETLKAIELQHKLSIDTELSEAIVGCRLPSLRRLVLRGFWVPWSAPILCGLTHLEMHLHGPLTSAGDGRLDFSHEQMLSSIKNMPGLETLILAHCFPSEPWKDSGNDVLQLPWLKALQLEGTSAACFGLAKRLCTRPSCEVQLRCSDRTVHTTDIAPFLVAHASASADLPPWHTLSIKADSNCFFRLRMWRLCDALKRTVEFNPEMSADLDLSFHSPKLSLGPLKPLFQALPLRDIETVSIDYPQALDPKVHDWIEILGQCKELEAASISGDPAPTSFCTALRMTTDCEPAAGLQTSEQGDLFLGKLAVLQLSEVDFRVWHSGNGDASYSPLKRSLAVRQRVKAASIPVVGLLRCSIRQSWVDDLREVAIVTWDKCKGECGVGRGQSEVFP